MPGLQRAFLRAGARGVIATLWPIEDAYASQFSTEFYKRYTAGMPGSAGPERNAACVARGQARRQRSRTGAQTHDRLGARLLHEVSRSGRVRPRVTFRFSSPLPLDHRKRAGESECQTMLLTGAKRWSHAHLRL